MSKPPGREWDLPRSGGNPGIGGFWVAADSSRRLIGGTTAGAVGVAGGRKLTRARIDAADPIAHFTINPSFGEPGRPLTRDDVVYRFNNFYEFTDNKSASVRLTRTFRVDPWSLTIDGRVHRTRTVGLEEILKLQLEQRVYRFRCVEALGDDCPLDRRATQCPAESGLAAL